MENSVIYISLVAASKYIGAGIAVSGVIGAGAGIGIVFAGYLIAYARNPFLQNALVRYVFLGFALTEAMGLLACAVSPIILNVVKNWPISSQGIEYIFIVMRQSYLGLANKSGTKAWLINSVTQDSKVAQDEVNKLDTVLWRLSPLNQEFSKKLACFSLNVNKYSWPHDINMSTLQASKCKYRVLIGNSGSSVNRNVLRWRNLRSSTLKYNKRFYCTKGGRNLDHLEEDRPKGILELNEFIIKALNDIEQKKIFNGTDKNPVMKIVSNVEILKAAYYKVRKSHGVIFGAIPEVNEQFFIDLSKSLWIGSYKCSPSKRIVIIKPNGGQRPLGIPKINDKIVQEAIKMVIEPIFENIFVDRSYGFRPNRDCLKTIQRIKMEFKAVKWFIELDISKCFDSLNHKQLLNLICKKYFNDPLLYQTIFKILKAGYIFMSEWNETTRGVSQGSILGPLMCNIYLHEIDLFLEDYKQKFDLGQSRKRKISKAYREYLKNKKTANPVSVYDPFDETYKRIWYVRYADDYLIGVIGSIKDCYKIRQDIDNCMKKYDLNLNLYKSNIVSASLKGAYYLGYKLKILKNKNKPIRRVVKESGVNYTTRITPRIGLLIPFRKLYLKLVDRKIFKWLKNGRWIRGTANNIIQHLELSEIVLYFRSLWSGIKNYYRLATNMNMLNRILYPLWCSCALTIAKKMKLRTISQVIHKYGLSLNVKKNVYFTYRNELSKKSIKSIKNHQLIPLTIGINTWIQKYTQRTIRTNRSLGSVCSICGSEDRVVIHHVNKLSNQKKSKLTLYQQLHSTMNRRQIPVCDNCHIKIHSGKYNGIKL